MTRGTEAQVSGSLQDADSAQSTEPQAHKITRGTNSSRSTDLPRGTYSPRSIHGAGGTRGAGDVESVLVSLSESQPEAWRAYAVQLAEESRAAEEAQAEENRAEEAVRMLRRALARSAKSVEEARRLLLEAGLSAQRTQHTIHRFQEHGQLDDHELARQLIRRYRDRGGHGTTHVRHRLLARKLSANTIETALAEHDNDTESTEDEHARAIRIARQRVNRLRGLEANTALRRLTAYLQRRGYEPRTALTAAREALAENTSTP